MLDKGGIPGTTCRHPVSDHAKQSKRRWPSVLVGSSVGRHNVRHQRPCSSIPIKREREKEREGEEEKKRERKREREREKEREEEGQRKKEKGLKRKRERLKKKERKR